MTTTHTTMPKTSKTNGPKTGKAPTLVAPSTKTATPVITPHCIGENGTCTKKILAKGMCHTHYYRARQGKSIHAGLRPRRQEGVETQLVPPRVSNRVRSAVQAACERAGISEYEFMRRLVESWYESYERHLTEAVQATMPVGITPPPANQHDGAGR